jgi:hypothetical protein
MDERSDSSGDGNSSNGPIICVSSILSCIDDILSPGGAITTLAHMLTSLLMESASQLP